MQIKKNFFALGGGGVLGTSLDRKLTKPPMMPGAPPPSHRVTTPPPSTRAHV